MFCKALPGMLGCLTPKHGSMFLSLFLKLLGFSCMPTLLAKTAWRSLVMMETYWRHIGDILEADYWRDILERQNIGEAYLGTVGHRTAKVFGNMLFDLLVPLYKFS